jgi:hypothetical protein
MSLSHMPTYLGYLSFREDLLWARYAWMVSIIRSDNPIGGGLILI